MCGKDLVMKRYFTQDEVIARLAKNGIHIKKSTLRNWRYSKRGPKPTRRLGRIVYYIDDLAMFENKILRENYKNE